MSAEGSIIDRIRAQTLAEVKERLDIAERHLLVKCGWTRKGQDAWEKPHLWPWRKPFDNIEQGYAVNTTKLILSKPERARTGAERRYLESIGALQATGGRSTVPPTDEGAEALRGAYDPGAATGLPPQADAPRTADAPSPDSSALTRQEEEGRFEDIEAALRDVRQGNASEQARGGPREGQEVEGDEPPF